MIKPIVSKSTSEVLDVNGMCLRPRASDQGAFRHFETYRSDMCRLRCSQNLSRSSGPSPTRPNIVDGNERVDLGSIPFIPSGYRASLLSDLYLVYDSS